MWPLLTQEAGGERGLTLAAASGRWLTESRRDPTSCPETRRGLSTSSRLPTSEEGGPVEVHAHILSEVLSLVTKSAWTVPHGVPKRRSSQRATGIHPSFCSRGSRGSPPLLLPGVMCTCTGSRTIRLHASVPELSLPPPGRTQRGCTGGRGPRRPTSLDGQLGSSPSLSLR